MTDSPPRDWSIRRRLSRRVLALVTVAWLCTILLATVFLDHEINEMLDGELRAVAQTTVLSLDATPGPVIPRSIGVNPDSGERVLRILRIGDPVPETPWPVIRSDGFHHMGGWRVLRVTAEDAVIEVAHNDAWRREEILEAASAFLVLMLPMIGLLFWGLGITLRQVFAPLERLAGSIAARNSADLSPVSDTGLPQELTPLAEGLNLYIARIGDLRRAERQFVANASHELRTPIAAIRARIDLSADPESRATLPLLDGLVRRVERLLQLSRSEAGLGLGRGPADLVQIARLLVREVGQGGGHPILLDDGDCESLMVAADPDAVAILVRNLLENALEHGTGAVHVKISPAAELRIRNSVNAAQFHDLPFAKRIGSSGAGLGLSIVDQLAQAMGIEVVKVMSQEQAEVVLRFSRP